MIIYCLAIKIKDIMQIWGTVSMLNLHGKINVLFQVLKLGWYKWFTISNIKITLIK